MTTDVVCYISGHGLGHAARSSEVLRALSELRPDLVMQVRSSAAPWFLAERLPPGVEVHPVVTDVGVLQADSFGADPRGSLERYAQLLEDWEDLVLEEVSELRSLRARVVLADIPPLGIVAGRAAGCRTFALGNFGWDWIYRPYLEDHPDLGFVVFRIEEAYGRAHELFRLPLSEPMTAFPCRTDVPLVARRSRRPPAETRSLLGLDPSERLVLLSFGGFGAGEIGTERLAEPHGIRFVGGSQAVADFPPGELTYTDVVAASDCVVSKPGYSLFAECLANGTPLVYVPREGFAEADLLVTELARLNWPNLQLPRERLVSGDWIEDVRVFLEGSPAADPLPANGAELVARRIIEACG